VERAARASLTRLTTAIAVISSALVMVISVSGPALAAPRDRLRISGIGGSAIVSAWMKATTSSSKPCVVSAAAPTCESSDPVLQDDLTNSGDTSGCTFTWSFDWGDGTKPQQVTASGEPTAGTYPLASHTYRSAATKTFTITVSAVSVTGDCTISGGTLTFTLIVGPCAAGTQPSGPAWVDKFPNNKSLDNLTQPFRGNVTRFIAAMTHAGIKERAVQTFRPAKRAYLMHYAWLIAHRKIAPQNVPAFPAGQPSKDNPYPGIIDICWVHETPTGETDLAASIKSAAQMVAGYSIDPRYRSAPAYPTLHSVGLAIDMTTTWTAKKITIVNGSGKKVTISTTPHSGLNRQLIAVGSSYHVIHFKNAVHDPSHWSVNGK
jgi:hypothetical protein